MILPKIEKGGEFMTLTERRAFYKLKTEKALERHPGAIPMKQWRLEQANKLGVPVSTVINRLYDSKVIPYPRVVRINTRVVLVLP